MYKVEISKGYEFDYMMIESNLRVNNYSDDRINKLLNKIDYQIDLLAETPGMGIRLEKHTQIPNDFRFLVCEDYLQFYKVYEKEKTVRVLRLINGRTDYLSNLGLI
ncbi:hypothetical protein COSHB9_11450 [Companilactobacillus alimentarius]|uniref:Addiction module toxin RelE n=2 Tax=Companilactobacillus alimentarius TaxID=1602 RepID=A0A2K9HKG3_9LACO|nr:hypothetical protein LA20249_09135 [Companilactobacillus alimentarius DSM 20249]GEO45894.1 hypothetical protein LAL01_21260 [Companilactobacillus alimentarius]